MQAVLDACADLVGRDGYAQLRTHAIAERAGVSVGTLYQYYPNKEAVAGALVLRALERMQAAMRQALAECVERSLESLAATEHLLLTSLDVLTGERAVFGRLAGEAPELFRTAAARDLQRALIDLSQDIRLASGDSLDFPMPEADAWIIGHMVSASMLQISLLPAPDAERRRLAREVARLVCRMALSQARGAADRPAA
ncbi:MAG TPA: TetR/AcrR family transcriptional regulator [Caulobacteraceae bacterium]|nr:TetR/AcrR family transcriptional regulator [Caulobacteraceae bacterium]